MITVRHSRCTGTAHAVLRERQQKEKGGRKYFCCLTSSWTPLKRAVSAHFLIFYIQTSVSKAVKDLNYWLQWRNLPIPNIFLNMWENSATMDLSITFIIEFFQIYYEKQRAEKDYPKGIGKDFVGINGKTDAALEVNGEYLTIQHLGLLLPVRPLWE